jgi:antitoxin ParD1/3/4
VLEVDPPLEGAACCGFTDSLKLTIYAKFYNPCMNVSLTPELDALVQRKVASGLYNSASEVVREALRAQYLREQESAWMAQAAAVGYAQLQAGAVKRVSSRKAFKALIQRGG